MDTPHEAALEGSISVIEKNELVAPRITAKARPTEAKYPLLPFRRDIGVNFPGGPPEHDIGANFPASTSRASTARETSATSLAELSDLGAWISGKRTQ